MLSNLLHTGRRRTKDESICKLDYDIAAGIHSTTASEFRLFPQLTNSWLLTTDYQYSGYYSCCLEYRCTVQKAR